MRIENGFLTTLSGLCRVPSLSCHTSAEWEHSLSLVEGPWASSTPSVCFRFPDFPCEDAHTRCYTIQVLYELVDILLLFL